MFGWAVHLQGLVRPLLVEAVYERIELGLLLQEVHGRSANTLDRTIVLNNPGLTRYLVENLSSARWHFAMTPIRSSGVESKRTKVDSREVG